MITFVELRQRRRRCYYLEVRFGPYSSPSMSQLQRRTFLCSSSSAGMAWSTDYNVFFYPVTVPRKRARERKTEIWRIGGLNRMNRVAFGGAAGIKKWGIPICLDGDLVQRRRRNRNWTSYQQCRGMRGGKDTWREEERNEPETNLYFAPPNPGIRYVPDGYFRYYTPALL